MTNYFTRKIDNIGSIAAGLSGAAVMGQFPQFIAQYVQRLGGHIDEATIIQTTHNIPQLAERITKLQNGLEQIVSAGPLSKLPAFLMNAEWSIAYRAWQHMTPGITFDKSGLLYMGVGAVTAYILYEVAKGAYSLNRKKKS